MAYRISSNTDRDITTGKNLQAAACIPKNTVHGISSYAISTADKFNLLHFKLFAISM